MYTPHTITLIIAEEVNDGILYNPVVLRGVFLDLSKRSNLEKTGHADADAATLYIPMSINPGKQYLPPKAYREQTDKAQYWTLFDGGKDSGTECFFIKGEVTEEVSYTEAREHYDYVYRVTSVDMCDYGSASMQHWEVGGR